VPKDRQVVACCRGPCRVYEPLTRSAHFVAAATAARFEDATRWACPGLPVKTEPG
jgi:hypothetical protein